MSVWKNRNSDFWVFKDVIESCQGKMYFISCNQKSLNCIFQQDTIFQFGYAWESFCYPGKKESILQNILLDLRVEF